MAFVSFCIATHNVSAQTAISLQQDGGEYYVNWSPDDDLQSLTLTTNAITTFKIYDDGGKNGDATPYKEGLLYINVPNGYKINLSGYVLASKKQYGVVLRVYDAYIADLDDVGDKAEQYRLGSFNYLYASNPFSVNSTDNFITVYFWGNDDPPFGGLDLTANLLAVEYSITYNCVENATFASANPSSYTVESNNLTLVNPTKDGYTFLGWTYDGQTEPVETVTIPKGSIGNKEFTANWAKNLTSANVADIPAKIYNGEAIEPEVVVMDGSKTLVKGTDYEVSIPEGGCINAGIYTITITGKGSYTSTVEKTFTIYKPLNGEGTKDNPYIIANKDDWDAFANIVNSGAESYKDKFVKLTADLDNVSTMVGTDGHNFQGTFLGDGHTLTFNLGTESVPFAENDAAPFRYVDGATIEALHVTGDVYTSARYVGGISSSLYGNCIFNSCRSSINIHSTYSGDGTHGGLVGLNNPTGAKITFNNCLFDGVISGENTTNCGGFVGWYNGSNNGEVHFNNCLMAGVLDNKVDKNSATFSRNGVTSINNSYYKTSYGTAQGIDGSAMSNEQLREALGSAWEVIKDQNGNEKVVPIMPKHFGAITITTDENGTTAVIDGEYTGTDATTLPQGGIEVDKVTINRNFTSGAYSTIVLPFDAIFPDGMGTFYTFRGVKYNENGDSKWTAYVQGTSYAPANTPFIFEPEGTVTQLSWNASSTKINLNTDKAPTTSVTDDYGDWTFTGTYQKKVFGEMPTDQTYYGFAGANEKGIAIGEFVHGTGNAFIRPFRCYLAFDDANGLSKSAVVLPSRIEVRVISSVIDPADPEENPNGDIETPTSELIKQNVNVWSFDKTIYIAAAPSTPYTIVDVNGRPLQTGITATDRDEVHLSGKVDGIVIVIINGKSFKIRY